MTVRWHNAHSCMLRDISRAATECVNAPHEMNSTPVAAMADTVARVTLPEASVSNWPATSSTASLRSLTSMPSASTSEPAWFQPLSLLQTCQKATCSARRRSRAPFEDGSRIAMLSSMMRVTTQHRSACRKSSTCCTSSMVVVSTSTGSVSPRSRRKTCVVSQLPVKRLPYSRNDLKIAGQHDVLENRHLRTLHRGRNAACSCDVVVFDHDHIIKPHSMIYAAANQDGPLIQYSQTGIGLPCIKYPRLRSL